MKMLRNNEKMGHWKHEIDRLIKIKDDITGMRLYKKPAELKVYHGFNGKYFSYTGCTYNSLQKFKTFIAKNLRKVGARFI